MSNTTPIAGLKTPTDTEVSAFQANPASLDIVSFIRDNFNTIDDLIASAIIGRLTNIGTKSLIAEGSLYLRNDNNFFGYKNDGTPSSLATMEQNNIAKFGDYDVDAWIAALNAVSVRAPKLTVATELRSDGTAINTREAYHEGNLSNHAMCVLSSNINLLQNTRTKLSNMTVNSQHPLDSCASGSGAYTVPRSGVYMINMTARPVSLANAQSVLRFGLSKTTGGVESFYDIADVFASSAWGSGFYNASFMFKASAGDVLAPFVNSLNEAITLQAGTKFNIYYLGNTPTTNTV